MSRVYEALRRAAEQKPATSGSAEEKAPNDNSFTDACTSGATENRVANAYQAQRSSAPSTSTSSTSQDSASTAANPSLLSSASSEFPLPFDVPPGTATIKSASPSFSTGASFVGAPTNGNGGAHASASNERTEQVTGSALSGEMNSRVAGATLDAARSTRALNFPVVEVDPTRVEPHLVAVNQTQSIFAEQFRALRTRVLHAGESRKMQTFVVSSAGVAEGKTTVAINLAWLLAQAEGVRVLLIDGDLRRPCAADYLDLDPSLSGRGLSEVLGGEATLAESIVRLEPSGLHLLPGGTARPDAADLLTGPTFLQVLAEARRMFDYVVIDAPPLGIFTDGTVLMNRADGALMVVRSGRVRYSKLDRLIESLPQNRLLGVVLNATNEQLEESDYYYNRYAKKRYALNGDGDSGTAVESHATVGVTASAEA